MKIVLGKASQGNTDDVELGQVGGFLVSVFFFLFFCFFVFVGLGGVRGSHVKMLSLLFFSFFYLFFSILFSFF